MAMAFSACSHQAQAIKRQQILLNGEPTDSSRFVQTGDIITCSEDGRVPTKVYELQLAILHEDEHFAVIVKPAGLPTNGAMLRT